MHMHDSRLKEANRWTPAVTCIHLKPLKKLNEVFPEPLQEDLVHIIFEHGPVRVLVTSKIPPLT